MREAIALAVHPANKDAGAEPVRHFHINGRAAVVFKVEAGYVPGYKGMTCEGYFADEDSALEWLVEYASLESVAHLAEPFATQVEGALL